jgi:uncharacterized membrane protein
MRNEVRHFLRLPVEQSGESFATSDWKAIGMGKSLTSSGKGHGGQLPEVLAENIRVLLEQHREDLERGSRAQAVVRKIAGFVGSVGFIYLHLLFYGVWVLISAGVSSLPRLDPHLERLAACAALESLFLSACILFNQNRNQKIADERAQLHLNISLLAERESTRLMQMAVAIAERLGIPAADDSDLKELMKDIQPKEVLEEIKRTKEDGKKAPGDLPARSAQPGAGR